MSRTAANYHSEHTGDERLCLHSTKQTQEHSCVFYFMRSLTVIEDVDCDNDGRQVVVTDSSSDIAGEEEIILEEVIILEEGTVMCWR